jgi:hypothetical protein
MPIRDFKDHHGTHWRVWSTVPSVGGLLGNGLEAWLTFESSGSRRRLSPIPNGWENANENQLESLCETAREVVATNGSLSPKVRG